MKTHIIGLPIIGENRELKFSIENFVNKNTTKNKTFLKKTLKTIIKNNIKIQKKLSITTIGFHYICDPITYTLLNLGLMPYKFKHKNKNLSFNEIIALTKGNKHSKALKMTKWFGTNYHFFIPEICTKTIKKIYKCNLILNEIKLLKNTKNKISIIGPITFIKLCLIENKNKKHIIKNIIKRYKILLLKIKNTKKINWYELEEPILKNNIKNKYIKLFSKTYKFLNKTKIKIIIGTAYNKTTNIIKKIIKYEFISGIHTDINSLKNLKLKTKKIISIGITKGNDIWIANYSKIIKNIKHLKIKTKNLWISNTCSLIHIPYNVKPEKIKHKNWISFTIQKINELNILKNLLKKNKIYYKSLIKNKYLNNKIKKSKKNILKFIKKNKINIKNKKHTYISKKNIGLKNLTNTTIGSFPQSKNIRSIRKLYSTKKINKTKYIKLIKKEIINIIKLQQKHKIDVIVNGELERNDMVEYFCEKIKGCITTKNGWVQSYNTRCVKPSIIIDKIKFKKSITIKWTKHLIKNSKTIIKTILTGPITLAKWAFCRSDIKFKNIVHMFSVFLKLEIKKLIKTGTKIIQVDEPAIKEAMPINKKERIKYFKWATKFFKNTCNYAYKNKIQVHTHICYSTISVKDIKLLAKIGIDVLTIEASKSINKIVKIIKKSKITKNLEIGLGIYDVHSQIIPTTKTLISKIKTLTNNINYDKIWINPDCGLKTRTLKEVEKYLINIKKAINISKKNLYL